MLAIAGVPAVLILAQPDLGTMLVLSATVFGVLAVSGARRRWLVLVLLSAGGVAAAALAGGVLKAYQVDRFLAFVNPDLDPRGAGYNVEQARIAIGNGGLFGQGLFHGSQTRSGFVPEQQTDFVFTVAGEELGLLGAGLLIVLLAVVIWRALVIARRAEDVFGRVAAAGIACWFGFQAFQNIGMCLGIMPVTGVPLPFVSYGGSSLFAGHARGRAAAEHPRAVAGADVRRAVGRAAGAGGPMTREAFVQRMNDSTLGAFDIASTYLGLKLGFYRSLVEDGPATAAELAGRTGTNKRMVREWLEQQGATELLTATRDGGEWRFAVPPGHDGVCSILTRWTASAARCRRWSPTWRRFPGWSSVPHRCRHPVRRLRPRRGRGSGDGHPAGVPGRDQELALRHPRARRAARRRQCPGAGHRLRRRLVECQHRAGLSGREGGRRRSRSGLDRSGPAGGGRGRGDRPGHVRGAGRGHVVRRRLRRRD